MPQFTKASHIPTRSLSFLGSVKLSSSRQTLERDLQRVACRQVNRCSARFDKVRSNLQFETFS